VAVDRSSNGSAQEPTPTENPVPDPPQNGGARSETRRKVVNRQFRRVVEAIRRGDDQAVQDMVLQLSRQHRLFAPLALVLGAFGMLFEGVKLLVTNWRLTLVQILPAMWIWAAMLDLKVHALHGKQFTVIRGPILIPIFLAVVTITAGAFFLNAVFAFAISQPGKTEIRPAFATARGRMAAVLWPGAITGALLAFAAVVVVRWGLFWFTIALSIVIGIMMIAYVAIPSRLIGVKSNYSRRDKLTAAAVGGALGAIVCSPPYMLGRFGIILLGTKTFFALGVAFIVVGVVLQTGATSAVKTIKMSAKLVANRHDESEGEEGTPPGSPLAEPLATTKRSGAEETGGEERRTEEPQAGMQGVDAPFTTGASE
jgi:hypothetical protein